MQKPDRKKKFSALALIYFALNLHWYRLHTDTFFLALPKLIEIRCFLIFLYCLNKRVLKEKVTLSCFSSDPSDNFSDSIKKRF